TARPLSTTGEEEAKLEQKTDRRRSAPFTIAGTADHDGAKQAFTISEMRIDIQRYNLAPGPAVVPLTGTLDIDGTSLAITIDPDAFRFDGAASAAFVDLELGTFAFTIEPIPESSTFLLLACGLAGLAAVGRQRRSGFN
ncbi:unnamed protein product, partial [marine sediment metagenome]